MVKTNNRESLETDRKRLVVAARLVLQRYRAKEIDLDEAIEELRPIRMQIHKIDCLLDEIKKIAHHSRKDLKVP